MSRLPRIPFALGFALLAASAAAANADSAGARIAAAMVKSMTAYTSGTQAGPGCAISVTAAGRVLLAAGYGYADIEHRVPFGPRTVSETGSVAKQFVAASILMLAEQGRLSLEDDIRTYLPEMRDYGEKIRIYDLLHQTSGLREWSTLAALRGYPRFYRKVYVLDDLLGLVSSQQALNFTPGTRYEYSNSNYGLLTVILERASGLSINEFDRRYLFGPLGMNSTQWRVDHRAIVRDRAIAYRRTKQGFEQAMPTEDVYGHGALLTTVEDLQRWNHALLTGGLSDFVTERLLAPGILRGGAKRSYGAGIRLTDYRGHRLYRHGGSTAGYAAQLWTFPDDGLSMALLCNAQPADTGELAAHLADAALGLTEPGPVPATASATQPGQHAATPDYYLSPLGEMVALRSEGDRRFVNLFTRPGFMEIHAGDAPGLWVARRENYGNLTLRFEGKDAVVISLDDREPTTFTRVAPAAPSLAITGLYENQDLPALYAVRAHDNGYGMELVDSKADDRLRFDLEWLNANTYLARIDTKSGYIRDDFIVTFEAEAGQAGTTLSLSSVAGLQGIDRLKFKRIESRRGIASDLSTQ